MAEQPESIEECVAREVLEETGLGVAVTQLLDVIGGNRVCIVFYEVSVIGGLIQKSEESLELAWSRPKISPLSSLPSPGIKEVLQR